MTENKKYIWQYPWGYSESFIIALTLMILGLVLNFIKKTAISAIHWPANVYLGITIVLLLLFIYFLFKKNPFIKWLSSTQAAVSAICYYTFLVLLMGFIPQKSPNATGIIHDLGLSNITHSYTFLFAQIYFLTTLGMVTLRRSFPFKGKNIAFFINHFGLWLTLFAASIGAGDMQRVIINVNTTSPIFSGINQNGETIDDLGIAIQLEEFFIEEYSPKAFIIDSKTGDILNEQLFYVEKGNKANILGWNIEVSEFYEYAIGVDSIFHAVYDIGAAPAAYIKATNTKTKDTKQSWISCGSFRFQGSFLQLSDEMLLVMADPEPKRYSSDIKIYTPSGDIFEENVEVNKPATVNAWKIYQIDYNHDMGKWSDTSVLELVKDPWIPVVYFGIIMLIVGSLYIFWVGNKKR